MKDFFNKSTKKLWDEIADRLDISDIENTDEYGLSVWGQLLGINRPLIHWGVGDDRQLSASLYRRLLAGRAVLATSNSSVGAYIEFVNSVFGGKVKVVDNHDMALSFEFDDSGDLSDGEEEMKLLIEQYPDTVFVYPAGVRSAEHDSTSLVFRLTESTTGAKPSGQPNAGGLDESTFAWRNF